MMHLEHEESAVHTHEHTHSDGTVHSHEHTHPHAATSTSVRGRS